MKNLRFTPLNKIQNISHYLKSITAVNQSVKFAFNISKANDFHFFVEE